MLFRSEVVRGLSGEVAQEFARRAAEGQVKGEIVLVIDAPSTAEVDTQASASAHDACEEAAALLAAGELSKKEIVAHLRKAHGLSRNDAYEIVHGA